MSKAYFSSCSYPNGDDVAGAVDHRQPSVHQQLPHVFDVPLMGPAQTQSLCALQDPHRLQRSGQSHWRKSRGEDEACGEGAYGVHQGGAARNVAPDTTKGLT